MPRVQPVDPTTATGELADAFAAQMKQFGRVSNFYQVMGNVPAAIKAWTEANRGVRLRYLKEDRDFLVVEQMVIIRTSSLNGSAYCLGHNVDLASEIGVSEEVIQAVQSSDFEQSELLDDRQKAAIAWAQAVTEFTARDDDQLFQRMRDHFTDRQIVELTVLIGMWNYSNRFTEALHIDLEPSGKRLNFFHGHSGE